MHLSMYGLNAHTVPKTYVAILLWEFYDVCRCKQLQHESYTLYPNIEVSAILTGPIRPRSESESERQRARNGASESERDFIPERARKITSESKRATF